MDIPPPVLVVRCVLRSRLPATVKRASTGRQRRVDGFAGRDYDARMLHARLFGPLRISVDTDAAPDVTGLKPRAVLAWLLMHPGLHPRESVAARFWPDVLDTSARGSLRSALWVVRAALETVGGAEYLVGDRERVGIDAARPRRSISRMWSGLRVADDPGDWEAAFGVMGEPLLGRSHR